MHVDVSLTPDELLHTPLDGKLAIVIDVLRATTSAVTALENGALGVYPVTEVEDARALADSWPAGVKMPEGSGGVQRPLLAGERGARPPEGFDAGNSPFDFSPDAVGHRAVILTTTNGTRALERAARGAAEVRIACLRNAAATAEAVRRSGRDVLLVCAGVQGRFSMEDAACAAQVMHELESAGAPVQWSDGARLLRHWFDAVGGPFRDSKGWANLLAGTFHGQRLLQLGFSKDIEFCADLDASTLVPRLEDGWLVDPDR